jgi:hypothetical protein
VADPAGSRGRERGLVSGSLTPRSRAAVRGADSDGHGPRGDGRADGTASGRVVLWGSLRARDCRPGHVCHRDRALPDRDSDGPGDGGGYLPGRGAAVGNGGRGLGAPGDHPRPLNCGTLSRPVAGRTGGQRRRPGRAFADPRKPEDGGRAGGPPNLCGLYGDARGGVSRPGGRRSGAGRGGALARTRDRRAGDRSQGDPGHRLRDRPSQSVPPARPQAPGTLRRGGRLA